MNNLTTYLTSQDYRKIKGIDLDMELEGSSDEETGDANRMIYRAERKVIAYLVKNYNFTEAMLEDSDKLEGFKLGICDQIEEMLAKGLNAPICQDAKDKFYEVGLMNWRCY